jgi:hypothetical protein
MLLAKEEKRPRHALIFFFSIEAGACGVLKVPANPSPIARNDSCRGGYGTVGMYPGGGCHAQ